MTYEEAFGWIAENVEFDEKETFDQFLSRVRESFYSQALIDTLLDGVTLDRTIGGKSVAYQQTLEQFFKELRPNSS